ncbi:hypothetical protein [Synechococcus phage BUCT-ZZ01]|nr:hypothetical protein [Synechococcus phage BUCT-ZZ01]
MDIIVSNGLESIYDSIKYLVHKNNGFYKSKKQGKFMSSYTYPAANIQHILDSHNIQINPDTKVLKIELTLHHADYGTRSITMMEWLYVFDEYGIKDAYNLRYSGNAAIGFRADPARLVKKFVRTAEAQIPTCLTEEDVVPKDSEFIGEINTRQTFTGKIKKIRNLGVSYQFSYHGETKYQTVIDCDGSEVVLWGLLPGYEEQLESGEVIYTHPGEGDRVTFAARIKDHNIYNNRKQTIIQRVTKLKPVQDDMMVAV